jgi:hypothetical protein
MAVDISCALAWGDTSLLQRVVQEFNRQQQGQIRVTFQPLPLAGFLDRLRQMFRSTGRQIDVVGGDNIWTGQFASNGWIVDLTNRFEQRLPSRRCAFHRGDRLYSGASGAFLPALPQTRTAGDAQGACLDEREQLAGEHHRLRHIHRANPGLKVSASRTIPSRVNGEALAPVARALKTKMPPQPAAEPPLTACRRRGVVTAT